MLFRATCSIYILCIYILYIKQHIQFSCNFIFFSITVIWSVCPSCLVTLFSNLSSGCLKHRSVYLIFFFFSWRASTFLLFHSSTRSHLFFIFLWFITGGLITFPYDNWNKIPQATPCDATLSVSVSFISKLATYIHNFTTKIHQKIKVLSFIRIWA